MDLKFPLCVPRKRGSNSLPKNMLLAKHVVDRSPREQSNELNQGRHNGREWPMGWCCRSFVRLVTGGALVEISTASCVRLLLDTQQVPTRPPASLDTGTAYVILSPGLSRKPYSSPSHSPIVGSYIRFVGIGHNTLIIGARRENQVRSGEIGCLGHYSCNSTVELTNVGNARWVHCSDTHLQYE